MLRLRGRLCSSCRRSRSRLLLVERPPHRPRLLLVLCPLSHRVHENTGCDVFQQVGAERSKLELPRDAGRSGEVGEKLGDSLSMVKISDQIEETPHIGRDDEQETFKVMRWMYANNKMCCGDDVVEQRDRGTEGVSDMRRIRIKVNGRCRHIQLKPARLAAAGRGRQREVSSTEFKRLGVRCVL